MWVTGVQTCALPILFVVLDQLDICMDQSGLVHAESTICLICFVLEAMNIFVLGIHRDFFMFINTILLIFVANNGFSFV